MARSFATFVAWIKSFFSKPGKAVHVPAPPASPTNEAVKRAFGDRTPAEAKHGVVKGVPQIVSWDEQGQPSVRAMTSLESLGCQADVTIYPENGPHGEVADLRQAAGRVVPDTTFAPLYRALCGKKPTGQHVRNSLF